MIFPHVELNQIEITEIDNLPINYHTEESDIFITKMNYQFWGEMMNDATLNAIKYKWHTIMHAYKLAGIVPLLNGFPIVEFDVKFDIPNLAIRVLPLTGKRNGFA